MRPESCIVPANVSRGRCGRFPGSGRPVRRDRPGRGRVRIGLLLGQQLGAVLADDLLNRPVPGTEPPGAGMRPESCIVPANVSRGRCGRFRDRLPGGSKSNGLPDPGKAGIGEAGSPRPSGSRPGTDRPTRDPDGRGEPASPIPAFPGSGRPLLFDPPGRRPVPGGAGAEFRPRDGRAAGKMTDSGHGRAAPPPFGEAA
jgi:hypothetical protein